MSERRLKLRGQLIEMMQSGEGMSIAAACRELGIVPEYGYSLYSDPYNVVNRRNARIYRKRVKENGSSSKPIVRGDIPVDAVRKIVDYIIETDGITQTELARRVGFDEKRIRTLTKEGFGQRNVMLETVEKILIATGRSLDDFFDVQVTDSGQLAVAEGLAVKGETRKEK
jgi:ribosome-binding protein aMBF1 (putative translation factor)